MEIFKNNNVVITYDEENKQLTQTWSGFASSEAFREGIDATVNFTKSNPVKTILSDTLKQHVVKPDDAQYAASTMPTLKSNGMTAMAFIVPESGFTKLSLQKFSRSTSDPSTNYFMSKNEALQWLNKQ